MVLIMIWGESVMLRIEVVSVCLCELCVLGIFGENRCFSASCTGMALDQEPAVAVCVCLWGNCAAW